MKRMLALLLMLLLLPALPALAQDHTLEGLVTQLTKDGFLMTDVTLGEIEVHTTDDTKYAGMLDTEPLAVGQYVIVVYDGKMTRSLPPQITADQVSCFCIKGTVAAILEDSVLLTGDATWGDVYAHISPDMPALAPGDAPTVYFDGVMALSYPAQVTALYIENNETIITDIPSPEQ